MKGLERKQINPSPSPSLPVTGSERFASCTRAQGSRARVVGSPLSQARPTVTVCWGIHHLVPISLPSTKLCTQSRGLPGQRGPTHHWRGHPRINSALGGEISAHSPPITWGCAQQLSRDPSPTLAQRIWQGQATSPISGPAVPRDAPAGSPPKTHLRPP